MTRVIALAVLLFGASDLIAAVKIESSVNNGMKIGSTKLFKKAPKEIHIGQFCVWYRTARQKSGQVTRMRVELDLTEESAMDITTSAYGYLKARLEEKGFAVLTYDSTAIAETKTFKKFAKKKGNDAGITTGNPYNHRGENPDDYRIGTWSRGVNTAYLGHKASAGDYAHLSHNLGGKEGKLSLSLTAVIDFLEWDISVKNSQEHLNAIPLLRLVDEPTFGQTYFSFHTDKKMGGKLYGGHNYWFDERGWVESFEAQDSDVRTLVVDVDAYKAATLGLLKTHIDELVPRIDEAKTKGK